MCQPKNNPNWSLRKNLLCNLFLPSVIGNFVGVAIIIIIYISVSEIMITSSENALIQQSIDQYVVLAKKSGDLLNQKLKSSLEGSVSFTAFALGDTTRVPYSQSFIPSYYDWTPLEPLTTDFRHPIYPVSFNASTYYFPGSGETDIFSESEMIDVNQSAHLDNFFGNIYQKYEHLVQSYVGFEDNGLFRRYPGNFTEDRSYDPRQRGWYIPAKAKRYENIDYIVSEPYPDFNTLQWMITIAKCVYNENGNFIGVSGADLTITELYEIVDTEILETGKISVVQTDGVVIADPEWQPTSDDEDTWSYQDLEIPKISDETWSVISNTAVGETEQYEFVQDNEEYIAITNHLESFDNQFLQTVYLKKSEIIEDVQAGSDELRTSRNEAIGWILLTFALATAASGVANYFTAYRIAEPIVLTNEGVSKRFQEFAQPPTEERSIEMTTLQPSVGSSTATRRYVEAYNNMAQNFNNQVSQARERIDQQNGIVDSHFQNDENIALIYYDNVVVDSSDRDNENIPEAVQISAYPQSQRTA